MGYSKLIIYGYIRKKLYLFSFNTPTNIIYIIYKYFRYFEFQKINYYFNDEDNENIEKYKNLLLQSTIINDKQNIAKFKNGKSEIIVIDTLLTYKFADIININIK